MAAIGRAPADTARRDARISEARPEARCADRGGLLDAEERTPPERDFVADALDAQQRRLPWKPDLRRAERLFSSRNHALGITRRRATTSHSQQGQRAFGSTCLGWVTGVVLAQAPSDHARMR